MGVEPDWGATDGVMGADPVADVVVWERNSADSKPNTSYSVMSKSAPWEKVGGRQKNRSNPTPACRIVRIVIYFLCLLEMYAVLIK